MHVMTSVECPRHGVHEEAILCTVTGQAEVMCGGVTVQLTDAEVADLLAD